MVELIVQGPPYVIEISKIDEPSSFRIHRPDHSELYFKRVPVKARAFVPFRYVRKSMRRLEPKFVYEANVHSELSPVFKTCATVRVLRFEASAKALGLGAVGLAGLFGKRQKHRTTVSNQITCRVQVAIPSQGSKASQDAPCRCNLDGCSPIARGPERTHSAASLVSPYSF